MRCTLLTTLLLGVLAVPGRAHDGPPFPILVDEVFGDRTLTVWADPDVGVGTFYLYLPEEEGQAEPGADPARSAAAAQRIALFVKPTDGRLPEAMHLAEPAEPGAAYQRVILADFDRRGPWRLRFALPDEELPVERVTEIEVTPPGSFGPIDILWFVSPFLLVGFLWVKAVRQRRAWAASEGAEA